MTSMGQITRIILWLFTPEPSDNIRNNDRSPISHPTESKAPCPGWVKVLFWYGVTLIITLFTGIPR
ncbi:MAG: hypothetical protein KKB91_09925 [Proteobacteria bacterium]|nr:hypothetical protein [Desulfocapsa sp.]MBU3944978.1 hypothetical protein [Pseudomonadota bacterium]MCG2744073.1 hypothetical protein [Desulfobacteraceae bacterium]MBU3982254.1 hypothetical protein [Pseudomonadota bacterium]MBU4029851.1 hypothetical protein [Pseudomonadota bacterium]